MPRPRKNPDEILKRELRITPPNQELIQDWFLDDSILKFVAFKEGGDDTDKKLHYHCYIETKMTSQALPKWIYKVCNSLESGLKGNAVFFTREPHEHTFGYISKEKDVIVRKGFDQLTLDEWFTQSDDYKKQRATERKRGQRSRQDELAELKKDVLKHLQGKSVAVLGVEGVIQVILMCCHHSSIRFPARTQMEHLVLEILYPYDESVVIQYYARSFPRSFS